jgi:hypothetical protein
VTAMVPGRNETIDRECPSCRGRFADADLTCWPGAPGEMFARLIKRAAVRHTSVRIAIPIICSGLIDCGRSQRSEQA